MPHRDPPRGRSDSSPQLQDTSGICRRDNGGAGPQDILELSFLKLCRHLRLGDVVDPGTSAAPGRFRQFGQFHAWNSPREFPWAVCVIFCP